MPEENFETALTLLKGVLDYENFRDVDLVIEVRPEHQIQTSLFLICTGFVD